MISVFWESIGSTFFFGKEELFKNLSITWAINEPLLIEMAREIMQLTSIRLEVRWGDMLNIYV